MAGLVIPTKVFCKRWIAENIKGSIINLTSMASYKTVVRSIGLGYLDPTTLNPEEYRNREDEGILFMEKAGEILHRLKT